MKRTFAIGLFAVLGGVANAQFPSTDASSSRSVSGQFLVYSTRLEDPSTLPPELVLSTNYILLQPNGLTISSERIKQSLCRELGASLVWRGKIHLMVKPVIGADDDVTIVSERFRSGWNYRVELPQVVERQRFVRSMIQALLLEMANRSGGERSAEIPAWLAEGFTRHLLSERETELLPPSAQWGQRSLAVTPSVYDARRTDPMAVARATLRDNPPLTLAELSWPTQEQMSGEAGDAFCRSAQLFVSELLRLRDGRESFRAMLEELPGCYNWQTAFFRAFKAHFTRQIDLEKWWALQIVNCTGRDPGQLWTVADSSRQLDQILRASVEVRRTASEMPSRTEVTLQSVIREWDFVRQTTTLKNKVRDLDMARLHIAPEFVGLLDEYRRVLTVYLQRREKEGFGLNGKTLTPSPKGLTAEVVRQLDALDVRRQAMRPTETPAVGTAENTQPAGK